jgi:hypothetical protein
MKKQFNLTRYKELLKLAENGKILFLDLKLLSFHPGVESQINYDRRLDYFRLIDNFLTKKIISFEFRREFWPIFKN